MSPPPEPSTLRLIPILQHLRSLENPDTEPGELKLAANAVRSDEFINQLVNHEIRRATGFTLREYVSRGLKGHFDSEDWRTLTATTIRNLLRSEYDIDYSPIVTHTSELPELTPLHPESD